LDLSTRVTDGRAITYSALDMHHA